MKWATIALFIKFVLQVLKENGITLEEILKNFQESEGVHPLALRDIRSSLASLGVEVTEPPDRLAVEAERGADAAQEAAVVEAGGETRAQDEAEAEASEPEPEQGQAETPAADVQPTIVPAAEAPAPSQSFRR